MLIYHTLVWYIFPEMCCVFLMVSSYRYPDIRVSYLSTHWHKLAAVYDSICQYPSQCSHK